MFHLILFFLSLPGEGRNGEEAPSSLGRARFPPRQRAAEDPRRKGTDAGSRTRSAALTALLVAIAGPNVPWRLPLQVPVRSMPEAAATKQDGAG